MGTGANKDRELRKLPPRKLNMQNTIYPLEQGMWVYGRGIIAGGGVV
jgi:hypothetical protein